MNRTLNANDASTNECVLIPAPGQVLGTTCQPQAMTVYVGMSVYGCVRSFSGDIVNGVGYIVREILTDKMVVDIYPPVQIGHTN